MRRLFEGEFTYGEHHFYANRLEGEGAETTLHAHDNPHVALFWPDAEYEVYAIRSDGSEMLMPMDEWSFVYIAAKVPHRIRMTRGTVGKFVCMFSRHGPEGGLRADPKACTDAM